jgi:hypothetical protein
MTSIKPPAPGPTSSHPITDAARTGSSDASGSAPAGADGDAFKSALQGAAPPSGSAPSSGTTHAAGATAGPSSGVATASQLGSKAGVDPVSVLVQQVEAGRMNMEQAVEQLLNQTVSSLGKQLSAAQRAELSDVLRAALANDPTLKGLRGDVG